MSVSEQTFKLLPLSKPFVVLKECLSLTRIETSRVF